LPWDLYPLPGDKADANNGIGKQFSMGVVGGGNAWCESDMAGRQAIWEAHKQYTLELYLFFTTDPAVPPAIRVEPAWMTIGHSAGVAAALAVAGDRDVQKLDYPTLRARLVAQQQVLDIPADYKPPAAAPALEEKP